MAVSINKSLPPCPRCHGRMFPIPDSSESACFTCGHVRYAVAPETLAPHDAPPTVARVLVNLLFSFIGLVTTIHDERIVSAEDVDWRGMKKPEDKLDKQGPELFNQQATDDPWVVITPMPVAPEPAIDTPAPPPRRRPGLCQVCGAYWSCEHER